MTLKSNSVRTRQ